jgi:SAM-dependent methyltransferase
MADSGSDAFPPDALVNLSRGNSVSDEKFDRIFSKETRALSSRHWTPMSVALFAAKALGSDVSTRVLDVGCGPGKFCFIGAATTPAQYFGIEQRLNFVEEAESIRLKHTLSNVAFFHGNMKDLDWRQFQAFYLFNPFLENVTGLARIDNQVPLSLEHFNSYVEIVETKLALLPSGTKVMTYHGYGGAFPEGYVKVQRKAIGTNYLELWVRD